MQYEFKFPQIHCGDILTAPFTGVDISLGDVNFTLSTVERVSKIKTLPIRSRLSDSLIKAT